MTATNTADAELRMISPKELAMLVTMHRQALGWTQETLSEISAFQIQDIDAFNKPHAFKSAEQIKKDAEEFKRKNMTLPVTAAAGGKQLADLTEQAQMRCFQQPDNVSDEVAEIASGIFDYLADYGEVDELYTYSQKLEVHATLDEHLSRLKDAGYSLCYALRKTSIVGKDWVDKTPMPVGIAYAFAVKRGEEPKLVVVPKALDLGL